MLTKRQCAAMTDEELVRAERAFRAEIPRAQALLVEIRRELKKRRRAGHHEQGRKDAG